MVTPLRIARFDCLPRNWKKLAVIAASQFEIRPECIPGFCWYVGNGGSTEAISSPCPTRSPPCSQKFRQIKIRVINLQFVVKAMRIHSSQMQVRDIPHGRYREGDVESNQIPIPVLGSVAQAR